MITEKEIKTLAKLAKLSFSDEELASFSGQFEEIIEFAGGINASVEGDAQTIREVEGAAVNLSDLRADEVEESLPAEKVTSNVHPQDGYFAVRRVVK